MEIFDETSGNNRVSTNTYESLHTQPSITV